MLIEQVGVSEHAVSGGANTQSPCVLLIPVERNKDV